MNVNFLNTVRALVADVLQTDSAVRDLESFKALEVLHSDPFRWETVYQRLATFVDARRNCQRDLERGLHLSVAQLRQEWFERHTDSIEQITRDHMPSGSGFDCGTTLDLDRSRADKLIFRTEYHHMNHNGFYDGWTAHSVTVRPSAICGYTLTISGRDRNGIKEFIDQSFRSALDEWIRHPFHVEQERA